MKKNQQSRYLQNQQVALILGDPTAANLWKNALTQIMSGIKKPANSPVENVDRIENNDKR